MESLRTGGGSTPRADGTLVARTRELPGGSPRSILDAFDAPRTAWAAPDEPTVAGWGSAATVVARGPDRFDVVRDAAEDLFAAFEGSPPDPARPRLFGGFAFHDDHEEAPPWVGFPAAYFVVPRAQVTWAAGRTWLTVAAADPDDPADVDATLDRLAAGIGSLDDGEPDPPPGIADRRPTTSRRAWREQVTAALDRIESGALRKVVLAQALTVSLERDLSLPDALARLGSAYPDCHRFLVEPPGGGSFFGATPERLVSLRGRTVETGALAGSTGRGDTPEEDEWLAGELLASEKDRHEHDLVVAAVRDQLAPFATSVQAGGRSVRRLATVQHLRTPITAELGDKEHVLDLVEALHPTPAVGGFPPDLAWETIRETETFDRGWYAAPVGWFDAAGDGSFAVAIRSAVTDGTEATLFAGSGIVADSHPESEWDEVQLKYRPILDALE